MPTGNNVRIFIQVKVNIHFLWIITKLVCKPWSSCLLLKIAWRAKCGTRAVGCRPLDQGCQTYDQRAKTGPLQGWIRPAGWFCKVKTLFAWEVYPIVLWQLVTRFQLLETLTQLLTFHCFPLFFSCEIFPFSAYFLLHVHTGLNFQTGMYEHPKVTQH